MSEQGSVSMVLLGVAGVVLVLGVLVADLGGYLAAKNQAGTAADAAALAAAPVTFRPFGALGTPTREAALFAEANGSRLVWCRCPVDRSWDTREVEVAVVRTVNLVMLGRRRVTARSKASFSPTLLVPSGEGDAGPRSGRSGLEFQEELRRG